MCSVYVYEYDRLSLSVYIPRVMLLVLDELFACVCGCLLYKNWIELDVAERTHKSKSFCLCAMMVVVVVVVCTNMAKWWRGGGG